ncbi:TetR/AcrR family transcriptional regulator [Chitinivorax sp. PXF-14]|uniref:TetR/AcrR family transcriptional regulator n=1 Tax=Chitinivorax sp. PXF-14 TaxID=3230488 RepID=UPI003465A85E
MRPQKISRDELLQRCAATFKRYGYHGTSMDMLASACELTKASFYHHYPNKEALARDVLQRTHAVVNEALFAIAYDDGATPQDRLQRMNHKAKKLFMGDAVGCLMGVIAIDATYAVPELMPPIRHFIDDWAAALAHLFATRWPEAEARQLARQTVADFEGAILLSRIDGTGDYFDRVCERVAGYL